MQINFGSILQNKVNYDCNNKRSHKSYANLTKLKADTVSFRAKQEDFNEFDRFIQKKFAVAYTRFKNNKEFQYCCELELGRYYKKDYSARNEETTNIRKKILDEWIKYLETGNDVYTPAMKLLIIDGLTKNLKNNNNTEPLKLNPSALSNTMKQIQDKVKNGKINNINFLNIYKTEVNKGNKIQVITESKEEANDTGWVIIPSKEKDSENFEANVDKLKTLSHTTWCTKSFEALKYLKKGDFHVYLENGEPKIGIRFVDNTIEEIQGVNNNTKIPLKYLKTIESHIKNYDIGSVAADEIKYAKDTKIRINELEQKLGKPLNECTSEELFRTFGMLERKDDDGLLILNEYKQPYDDISWDYIGIKENNLFKNIKKIKGEADFRYSQIQNLGNLKTISGSAIFSYSQIQNLGNLETISGSVIFSHSKVENLGNLKTIGESTNFSHSKVENLGNLKTIGGDTYFYNSQITDLGYLEEIGGNASFYNSKVTNLGNLQTIGGNAMIHNSKLQKFHFDNIKIGGKIIE